MPGIRLACPRLKSLSLCRFLTINKEATQGLCWAGGEDLRREAEKPVFMLPTDSNYDSREQAYRRRMAEGKQAPGSHGN